MTYRLSGITVDCADPDRLADFWGALLGREQSIPLPNWRRLGGLGESQPVLNFQPVPEPKRGKARIHLDVVVDDVDAAVATVTRLGGRPTGERHDYADGVVVIATDPEGNEFCLVQYFGAANR
jgi:predicted enzyme related to lactoylglutathione lyase